MTKILVTGGAGFVGRHLCAELARQGHAVTALDDFSSPNSTFDMPGLQNPSIRKVKAALPDPKVTAQEVARNEVIFHLAALVGVEETLTKPMETVNNLNQTIGLLEHVTGDHRIIFSSSADVYGAHSHHYQGKAMKEDDLFVYEHAGVNRWVYAHVKVLEENLITACPARSVSIRLFNTFGADMDFPNPRRVISHFLEAIGNKTPMKLSGSGQQTRAFCFIDDMVDGLIKAMDKTARQAPGADLCYNIGGGEPISMHDLAVLCNKLAIEEGLLQEPLPILAEAFQYTHAFDDSWGRIPDLTRARTELGYREKTGLEEGLRKTICHYRDCVQGSKAAVEQV